MAHSVETRVSSPAAALRDNLALAERLVVNVDQQNVEQLLTLLDTLADQFAELEAGQVDLRPERGRWESLLRRLERRPARLVRAARQAGGMASLRERHPPAESFWWRLDKTLAARRRRALVQTTALVGGVIGAVVLVYWLINTLFPPDPAAVFMVETNARLEGPILDQDWETALAILADAQAELPDEAELYIWEDVIAAQSGDRTRSATAAARAQELMADRPVRYWVVTANHQLRVGDVAGAEASLLEALALDDASAQAHFLLGEIAELRGDFAGAVEQFDVAYELAIESDNQLAAMARIRMAGAMQRVGQPALLGTPTP